MLSVVQVDENSTDKTIFSANEVFSFRTLLRENGADVALNAEKSTRFWSNLWEVCEYAKKHNKDARWIKEVDTLNKWQYRDGEEF